MRWIVRLLAIVLLIVALAVGAIFVLPSQRIASLASDQISAAIGRDMRFSGPVRPSLFPLLGVRMGGLELANAPWATDGPMLRADSLLVGVELWPLLSGKIRVRKFRLVNPRITLERGKDGRANWQFGSVSARNAAKGAQSAGGAAAALAGFTLAEGRLIGASLRFNDHANGRTLHLDQLAMTMRAPEPGGTATAQGQFRYNGQTLSFKTTLGNLGKALDGALGAVSLDMSGRFGALALKGRAGMSPPQADIQFDGRMKNAAALAALAGLEKGSLAGIGKTASLKAKLTFANDNTLYLRALDLGLGPNRLRGAVDIELGAKPLIRATLKAGDLDLSAYAAAGGDTPAPVGSGGAKSGWSRAPLDASALQLADGEVDFSAGSVKFAATKTGPLSLKMRLDRGRLVSVIQRLSIYGGTLGGQVVLNSRAGLSVGADLSAKGVQLGPLLRDFAGYDRLTSLASMRVKLLSSGNSMQALASRLKGEGGINAGPGEIIGFDLLGMLRTLDTSYRGRQNKTIFTSIKGSYTIRNGVLKNSDLVFNSPLLTAGGTGHIDIGKRLIDYRITPLTYGGKTAGKLSVPVLLSGTWDHINVHPDLNGALKADLANKRAKAEADLRKKAKKAVKEGLQKSLGDALKRLGGGN